LTLAQSVGFNCLRVVLPFVVWEAEPDAFRRRFDAFLAIAARHGLRVMPSFFDDCNFGEIPNPVFGRQPEIVVGTYANAWTPSPGHALVRDRSAWPRLEKYVRDLLTAFGGDPRVWVWDLYNEPTGAGLGEASLGLVERVFAWAREIDPTQPVTVGQWDKSERVAQLAQLGDITTFHDYTPPAELAKYVESLKSLGRPVICTEWLNRNSGSTVADCLPILRREGVGAIHWGLVNGRTQTHLNYGHKPGEPDPPRWQHDLFHPDHTVYDEAEIALFREALAAENSQVD
jgi:hypothetical protein